MLQIMVAEERNKPAKVAGIAEAERELPYPSYRLLVLEEGARQALAPQPQLESAQGLYEAFDTYDRPASYYPDLIGLASQTGNVAFKYDVLLRCYAANFGEHAACDDEPAAAAVNAKDAAGESGSKVTGSLLDIFGRFKR